jgi:hypothetical protein
MVAFSDYTAGRMLEWTVGKTAMPALPSTFIALFTAVGNDDGTGFTEVAGGSYARKSTAGSDWGSATGTAPRTITNSGASLSFVTATGSWGDVIAFALYDASSAGNLLVWDYLGNHVWRPFTGSSATPSVLTSPAHGFANTDQVVVSAEAAGTLPATGGSWAGLKTVAGVTTDTFTAGVNTTGTGSGLVRKVSAQTVPSGVQVIFNTSTLTIALA